MTRRNYITSKIVGYGLFYVVTLYVYIEVSYPSGLSVDSYEMLRQGVSHEYSNWHSVFLSAAWGVLYRLFQDTGPIWLIQISLYVLAIISFCWSLRSLVIGFGGAVILAFFPPLLMNMHFLWKDCAAVIGTLFVLSCAMHSEGKFGKLWYAGAVLAAVIVCLIRIDYLIIVLPLLALVYTGSGRLSNHLPLQFKPVAYFFVIFLLANLAVQSLVTQKLHPWYTLAIWDIAGVHKRLADEGIQPLVGHPVINDSAGLEKYNCNTSDELLFGANPLFRVKTPYSEGKLPDSLTATYLKDLWKEAIVNHPLLYARHRFCVAKTFLGFKTNYIHGFLLPMTATHLAHPTDFRVIPPNSNSENYVGSLYYNFVQRNAGWLIYLYKYYLYMLGALAMTLVARSARQSCSLSLIAILISIYAAAARFIVLPASDFRYGLWIIVGTISSFLLFLDVIGYRRKWLSSWIDPERRCLQTHCSKP